MSALVPTTRPIIPAGGAPSLVQTDTYTTPTTGTTWNKPATTTHIIVYSWGAGGGGGQGTGIRNGGAGGYSAIVYDVSAISSLTVRVGGGGQQSGTAVTHTGGTNGGGTGQDDGGSGGGYSGVFDGATPLVIAGGGGGGGDSANAYSGAGGGLIGDDGWDTANEVTWGRGGTQSAGGSAGGGGNAGSSLQGGNHAGNDDAGGGGGYFGGGSGGISAGPSGGGSGFVSGSAIASQTLGGSRHVPPATSNTHYAGTAGIGGEGIDNGDDGRVVIESWDALPTLEEEDFSITYETASDNVGMAKYTARGEAETLSGFGVDPGFVLIKNLTTTPYYTLVQDSIATGESTYLSTETNDSARESDTHDVASFITGGFSLEGSHGKTNAYEDNYLAMVIEESSDVFQIITWTGNATARNIAHGLDTAPGFLMVISKDTDATAGEWAVYHANQAASPATVYSSLNLTALPITDATVWDDTAPDGTNIRVGTNTRVNDTGDDYVCYAFSDVTGKCDIGVYSGSGVSGKTVSVGFQPKAVIFHHNETTAHSWVLVAESIQSDGTVILLEADGAAPFTIDIELTATGFTINSTLASVNASGDDYVYIALK